MFIIVIILHCKVLLAICLFSLFLFRIEADDNDAASTNYDTQTENYVHRYEKNITEDKMHE